ncbi:PREDICTED: spidroin-2-like [Dipodomys ordii]|uniref:Spidroin-2-like n=1 Tax=Dipodomys ordii TaxID=10020 RepID=A0A1S3G107_DIPOR|nr:PREDICTED: spidroin-2-like [Dipodomys ordii]
MNPTFQASGRVLPGIPRDSGTEGQLGAPQREQHLPLGGGRVRTEEVRECSRPRRPGPGVRRGVGGGGDPARGNPSAARSETAGVSRTAQAEPRPQFPTPAGRPRRGPHLSLRRSVAAAPPGKGRPAAGPPGGEASEEGRGVGQTRFQAANQGVLNGDSESPHPQRASQSHRYALRGAGETAQTLPGMSLSPGGGGTGAEGEGGGGCGRRRGCRASCGRALAGFPARRSARLALPRLARDGQLRRSDPPRPSFPGRAGTQILLDISDIIMPIYLKKALKFMKSVTCPRSLWNILTRGCPQVYALATLGTY